jgi:hypothetical protein
VVAVDLQAEAAGRGLAATQFVLISKIGDFVAISAGFDGHYGGEKGGQT